jgi:hypothetical protein
MRKKSVAASALRCMISKILQRKNAAHEPTRRREK